MYRSIDFLSTLKKVLMYIYIKFAVFSLLSYFIAFVCNTHVFCPRFMLGYFLHNVLCFHGVFGSFKVYFNRCFVPCIVLLNWFSSVCLQIVFVKGQCTLEK